jgi:putative cardiolipin synthase
MTAASIPLRIACLAGLLAVLSACATLRTDVPRPVSTALPPTVQSPLAREAQRQVQAHPGQSGFRVLSGNTDALMSRIVLADHAARSIDLQYYIFADDATGRLLAQRLLAAADRGVRVRLLLDDLDVIEQDPLLDALDAHPNIEVRLFNPFRVRNRSIWSKALQFTVDGARLNRRMHNKSFTVDNLFTVVGGRNIGDAYFDAGNEIHFRDLDVLAIGPVVGETSGVFDRYWNSDAAFPVTAYDVHHATARNLSHARATLQGAAREFAESDYAQAMLDALPDGSSADRSGRWDWGAARVVADDPAKVEPGEKRRALRLTHDLGAMLDAATTNVQFVSPYFIPGRDGVEYLRTLVARGVKVSVLTNSLAATDEAAVHAGYARYRRGLLAGGIELYELRPLGGAPPAEAHGTSSGISLHAKTLVVDAREVFVGSMNMDPRSRLLNTEMGVIVDSPALARRIMQFFDSATQPENAFKVELVPQGGRSAARAPMRWTARYDGRLVEFDHDPETSAARRARVALMRLLPIESLL